MVHMLINQRVRSWRTLPRVAVVAALLSCALAGAARAAVTAVGDVLPADRLDTDLINEGLPPNGNFYDSSQLPNQQSSWENNQNSAGGVGIIVGQKAFGRLDIDGNSQLRYQTLVIGDQGTVGNQTRKGTGFMQITGIDALFNNDPTILPPGLPPNFVSLTPRNVDGGYDMYVGRRGTGTLEILGGGRAEIQDQTFVGDSQGSNGMLLVDGFASFLQTGGFEESSSPAGASRNMFIGRQGIGVMLIRNGGTVLSQVVQTASDEDDSVAAVIGGEKFSEDAPEVGGRGTVTVTGPTSQWIVGGTLQIGGYHETETGAQPIFSGENAEYESSVGRGTLIVADSAQVIVRAGILPGNGPTPEDLRLRIIIGRFGRLELQGGYVSLGDPGFQQDEIILSNDGVIEGGGRIDTALFRNRYFGEVRVNAGQKLLIDAASEVESVTLDAPPLVNWGTIDVIGTSEARAELEFERAPNAPQNPIQPFLNAALATQPTIGRGVGQIIAANATLRFRSGLLNQGKLAFTAGDNIIAGPVVNLGGTASLPDGEIGIAGNQTTVVFEDHFINNGRFEVFPNASLALFMNDFTQTASGTALFTIGGRPPIDQIGVASVLGDLNLDGTLNVQLFAASAGAFNPVAGDQYQIMVAAGLVNGIFAQRSLPPLPPGLQWDVDYIGGVILRVVDGSNIMGADFNGDGIVDINDYQIWLANVGITSGATGADGDADGDGDVDSDDFLIWQQTLGPVPPGSSAILAGGQNNLSGNVPEPTSVVLLALGGLLGLVFHRRRA